MLCSIPSFWALHCTSLSLAGWWLQPLPVRATPAPTEHEAPWCPWWDGACWCYGWRQECLAAFPDSTALKTGGWGQHCLPQQTTPPTALGKGRKGVLSPLGAPAWLAAAPRGVSGAQAVPVFSGCIVYVPFFTPAFLYTSQRRGIKGLLSHNRG